MASKAIYKVLGVGLDAKIYSREIKGAPSDERLALWAQRKKLAYVSRYFPSRKGWIAFECSSDLQILTLVSSVGNSYSKTVGFNRLRRVYPTEDAAIMLMLHKLNPPVQETLKL